MQPYKNISIKNIALVCNIDYYFMCMKHKPAESVPKGRLSFKWCLLVYLCLTGINLVVHNRMIDSQPDYIKARQGLHQDVMAHRASANIQPRIMVHYAAEGLQRIGFSFQASYLVIRGITTFLAAYIFHIFLAHYFSLGYCFIGVLLLFGGLPVTYINYYMQETDALNLFFYILAFIMIRSRKDRYIFPILFISVFNRETTVLIPLMWLLFRWDELPLMRLISRFFAFVAAVFIPYVGLRLFFGEHKAVGDPFQLLFNLNQLNSYLYFILLLGPFLIISLKGFNNKPKFIRRAVLFAPFFVVFHFCLTIFQEARLMLPLYPILIPAAFSYLFETQDTDTGKGEAAAGWLNKYCKVIYIFLFIIFLMQMWAFNLYFKRVHVVSWEKSDQIQLYLKKGHEYYIQQQFTFALQTYSRGLAVSPDSFDLHFNIAQIYTYHLKDHTKAYFHWSQCLKIDPQNPRIQEVLNAIDLVR